MLPTCAPAGTITFNPVTFSWELQSYPFAPISLWEPCIDPDGGDGKTCLFPSRPVRSLCVHLYNCIPTKVCMFERIRMDWFWWSEGIDSFSITAALTTVWLQGRLIIHLFHINRLKYVHLLIRWSFLHTDVYVTSMEGVPNVRTLWKFKLKLYI